MTSSSKWVGAAAGAALAFAAVAAHAEGGGKDDAREAKDFLGAGMTVAQAAAAAEKSNGGTAMGASWEPTKSGAAFEVELAKADGTVTTVLVDPGTGAVTPASAPIGDSDGEEHDDN
ncbi:MAG: PepSY domain-containing protein [Amaricoccus sp.]